MIEMKKSHDDSEEIDAISLLESVNVENSTIGELRELITHLKHQFKNRYCYLVGEWSNAKRAKSTINGKFVSAKEVIDYLNT